MLKKHLRCGFQQDWLRFQGITLIRLF